MSDLTDRIAAALAQPNLDHILGWNLFDDDDIDGDVAVIASRLRDALADSGLSDAEIKEGLADLAATGGLLVDDGSTDFTTTISVAGLARRVYVFRGLPRSLADILRGDAGGLS